MRVSHCLAYFILAVGATSAAVVHSVLVDDDLAPTVMLQVAIGLQHQLNRTAVGTEQLETRGADLANSPGAPRLPMEQLATVGGNGELPWPLWPAAMPGEVHTEGPERTSPVDWKDPIFYGCGGYKLPSGYPDNFFTAHWTTDVAKPRLLPFLVPRDAPNRQDAAVVVAPGGGGKFLAIDGEGRDVAAWLNSFGVSAFVLAYRASPIEKNRLVAQIMDSQRAVRLVRSRAQSLGLNASRIGFMGFSHGGMLTVATASTTQAAYSPVDGVDSASFRPDFLLSLYGAMPPLPYSELAPPAPNMFIGLSQNDPCTQLMGVQYWYDLHKKGGPSSQLHVYEEGKHGWGTCFQTPYINASDASSMCTWTQSARGFIQNVVLEWSLHAKHSFEDKFSKRHPNFVRELVAAQRAKRKRQEAQWKRGRAA